MVILHIAAIENNPLSGVCVAAPQHVIAQKAYAEVGFINIRNTEIEALKDYPGTQMSFTRPFDLTALPAPFDKPDIVIFHECYRKDYLAIGRQLKRARVPYVVIPHGELRKEAQQKKRIKKLAANLLLFNRFTQDASAIQCLSKREADNTAFGRRKIIGTNGVKIPARRKSGFSREGTRFVYIGRLEAYVKGLDLMVEAFSAAGGFLRENNCHLAIYGPDLNGRFAHVEELIREHHAEDLITLHHEVFREEKEKILLAADIFIQTSRFEGMPLGILEALSYGIPCFVTEGTTMGDMIEGRQAGWASETTAEGIATKLVQAVHEKDTLSAKGQNAIRFVQEQFSWDRIAEGEIKEYEVLIAAS